MATQSESKARGPAIAQPPIGIDLGTTYSAIAYLDASGRPTSIANESGDVLTPSAVSFDADTIVVGKEAVKAAVFEPAIFADCFKRDMGRREFRRPIADRRVPPEVLSGIVLRQLKRDGERQLGCPVEQVVITVPAFFDETRRRATQEAGRLAGLQVLDIINEPTAAALAFGYGRAQLPGAAARTTPERILVYDLGGGTFDVTVLEIDGTTFRTLATDGDVQLGGRDFDERLMDYVAGKFTAAHQVDPRSDPHDAAKLWQDVQEAKHSLSQRAATVVPCFHGGQRMRVEVSREDFENLTADLLDRTETTVQLVLRQAQLTWDAVDRVLLVGGSTRMPMVGQMIRRVTGREPDRSLSADEAVAHGAALYCGLLMAQPGAPSKAQFQLINVNSHSLGIIGFDQTAECDRNIILIRKNTPLPCRTIRKFATARVNQSSVKVVVVEGESERPEHCIHLGTCVVRNLPPNLPKGTSVEVEYSYSANGRLAVKARVPAARQSAAVEIQYDAALGIPDLDSWLRRAQGVPATDANSSDLVEKKDDVTSSLAELDRLLIAFGEQAARLPLPSPFAVYKEAAVSAARALQTTTARLLECEKRRQSAIGQAELLEANANLAQAGVTMEQAEAATRAKYRNLAEACLAAEFAPQPLDGLYSEIKRLRSTSRS